VGCEVGALLSGTLSEPYALLVLFFTTTTNVQPPKGTCKVWSPSDGLTPGHLKDPIQAFGLHFIPKAEAPYFPDFA